MDYEKDVTIDPDALDTEWLEQPRLMMRYARISAQAQKDYEEEKQNLDIVKAQIDQDIRINPQDHGIEGKITEAVVSAGILVSNEYQIAQKKVADALYEYNMARGAIQAINGKKDALENLVRLHGQQYFAGPRVPRDLSKEWEQKEKQKTVDKKVGSTFKRKTK